MNNFNESFFLKKILKRDSFFQIDIDENLNEIKKKIIDKSLLVIGGAGTIGSNYIKEILKFKPSKIIVVDTNENGLTELTRDLRSSGSLDYQIDFRTYPINLNDSVFDKLFLSENNFDTVANFAAHKHVRSEKDIYSIEALIKNNVYGAIKLLKLLELKPPIQFFSVSTDKAANPVNIMGASKTIMENVILTFQNKFKVITARFANVAFSNGSLLYGFNFRISKKQPLACPSNIRRFFVTPQESGQICMLATFLGDSGNIFFPKFDFHKDQIYFKDIAINFIKHIGFKVDICNSEEDAKNRMIKSDSISYPIYFFESDTSGEKEYEEFYTDDEDINLNHFKSLGFIIKNNVSLNLDELIKDFDNIFSSKYLNKKDIIKAMQKYLLKFDHIEKGKNLDQKM